MAFSTSPNELDPADVAQDVHRLFDDLAQSRPERRHVVTGECMPVVDVFVTERAVEIVFDLPGVAADALRILIKNNVVLVVGEKERPEPSKRAPASFHLVERDYGRFARAVRVQSAFDASKTRARLANGELHVVLPRVQERRGQGLLIPIETSATQPGE